MPELQKPPLTPEQILAEMETWQGVGNVPIAVVQAWIIGLRAYLTDPWRKG